jgi:protein-histidine N-methyltransferase
MFSFNFYDDPVAQTEEAMDVDEPDVRPIKLEDILSQLPDTLAYSMLAGLPRRELWHIKMQIMQSDDNEHLLGDSDVIRGSYEGGLKTWECSVDLAEYLTLHPFQGHSVLEVVPFILSFDFC